MPTTPEGKSISARNALKHGLRARAIVFPDESQDDWEAFERAYVEDLAPVGIDENTLALRAAELLWRLRRIAVAERNAILDRQKNPDDYSLARYRNHSKFRLPTEAPDMLPESLPAPAALRPIMRYEAHLSRQLNQVTRDLQNKQDRRNGRSTQITRVEIHGYPGKTEPTPTRLPNELQNDVAQPASPVNHGSHGPPAVHSPTRPTVPNEHNSQYPQGFSPAESPAEHESRFQEDSSNDRTLDVAQPVSPVNHGSHGPPAAHSPLEKEVPNEPPSPNQQTLSPQWERVAPTAPGEGPNELTSLLKFPPELRSLLLKSDTDSDDLDLLDPLAEAEDEAMEDAMRGYPMPRFRSP